MRVTLTSFLLPCRDWAKGQREKKTCLLLGLQSPSGSSSGYKDLNPHVTFTAHPGKAPQGSLIFPGQLHNVETPIAVKNFTYSSPVGQEYPVY